MGSKNKKLQNPKKTGASNKLITDERFALSQKDPRFQDVPKHKNKVAIDSRFSRVFTDNNFSTSSAPVDKRGKAKNDAVSSQSVLKHYYRMDNDFQKKENNKVNDNSGSDSDSDSDSEYESEDDEKVKNDKEKLLESESELELSGDEVIDDYTSTDTDEDNEGYVEEETNAMQVENVPEIDKETHRLAVVNLDWNQVQAVDLFVVLSSFLPKTGQILSVSVYPSEFGLKRMEEEAVHGPVGLFDDEDGKNKNDDDSDNSGDDNEIDNEKLRAYELSRLKYYFAVVVCDSIATADYIYKSCDGIEFERSSNKLDLRFIPDSMEFKHPARDVATEAPSNYEGIDFQTRALQLSKIDLTWDENEPQRVKKFKRKINVDQESKYVKDELELKELIASSDSETDEDNNDDGGDKKRQKTDAYRALLQSGDSSDEEEEDEKMDMEVTFNTSLEDISKKILEKKDKESETVWAAHLRKQREKKKARKSKSKNSSDDDDGGSDDKPIEEPGDFFAGGTTKKKKASRDKKDKKPEVGHEGVASVAELELVLATDAGKDANDVKGYNLKRKKSKGKKGGKADTNEEMILTADYAKDARFSPFFTRPDFALDPTDPRYKWSAAYLRQVAHKQSKDDVDEEGQHYNIPTAGQAPEADDKTNAKKDKHEIAMLMKSVKMKSKQFDVSSHGKKSKRKEK